MVVALIIDYYDRNLCHLRTVREYNKSFDFKIIYYLKLETEITTLARKNHVSRELSEKDDENRFNYYLDRFYHNRYNEHLNDYDLCWAIFEKSLSSKRTLKEHFHFVYYGRNGLFSQ